MDGCGVNVKTVIQAGLLGALFLHTVLLIRNERTSVQTAPWLPRLINQQGEEVASGLSRTAVNDRLGRDSLDDAPEAPVPRNSRLGVASFVESTPHMYGVYSIRNQMKKFGMNATQVVVVPLEFATRETHHVDTLRGWLGRDNVYTVDKPYIFDRLPEGVWKGTFNKLWIFNLTDYDKLIVLDLDVLIRTNIMHWFDYTTPAATQPKDCIEWNSGAMVIEPNTEIFNEMVELLPNMSRYNDKEDNFNSAYHDQGFLSAFFTREGRRMHTLPTEAAPLSSSITDAPGFRYFTRHRMYIFETVHFTVHKPWRETTASSDPRMCELFREWEASVEGLERYGLKVDNDYFRDCPNRRRLGQGGFLLW